MTKKSYATHIWILLGGGVALMLFAYILVDHHRGMPERAQQQRGALMSSAVSVAERIKPVGRVEFAAAQTQPEPAKSAAAAPPAARDGQQVYQASCGACHGPGIAGAPKMGDKAQWAKPIAKGLKVLYAGAVNGMQGSAGVMPAKGGNPALSDAEVKAAVDYMVAKSK